MSIFKLKNRVKDYKWGSKDAIPALLGYSNKEGIPQAELWMGAHPMAPSEAFINDRERPLPDWIKEDPEKFLGKKAANSFNNSLPFLFKVLSAAAPLSIQVHPDLKQAAEGFERENRMGVELTAFNRTYKDNNHKPEIICALTEFTAMKGFRPVNEIKKNLLEINIEQVNKIAGKLDPANEENSLAGFYSALLDMPDEDKKAAAAAVSEKFSDCKDCSLEKKWAGKLCRFYPEDIGVLSPFILNLVVLSPGQALFLEAGEIHAYLEGTGMELMANSDNVLRGGLTPKFIDLKELLKVMNFKSAIPEILVPSTLPGKADCEVFYPSKSPEFILSGITVSEKVDCRPFPGAGFTIMICVEGSGSLKDNKTNQAVLFKKGDSFAVTADTDDFKVSGNAVLYRASIPV